MSLDLNFTVDDMKARALKQMELFKVEYPNEEKDDKEEVKRGIKDKYLTVYKTTGKHEYRKYKKQEEINLNDWDYKENKHLHILHFNDIYHLSFLEKIAEMQKLEYLAFSFFRVDPPDWERLKRTIQKENINFDFYIEKQRTAPVYQEIKAETEKRGGRICILENHCKLIIGFGNKFDFVVAGTANMMKSPEMNLTTITADTELADVYKNALDNFVSLSNDFDNWKPYQLERYRGGN